MNEASVLENTVSFKNDLALTKRGPVCSIRQDSSNKTAFNKDVELDTKDV